MAANFETTTPLRLAGQTGMNASAPSDPHAYAKVSMVFIVTMVAFALMSFVGCHSSSPLIIMAIVVIGWVLSVGLHEYGHALVAHLCGDPTIMQRGYLDMNFLRYIDPVTSVILPLIFIVMGGFALPGGSIRHQVFSDQPVKESLIAAAGPLGTIASALIFRALMILPFLTNLIGKHTAAYYAYAFLVYLEVMAVVLNLLPLPPLDGWGVIKPWFADSCFLKSYINKSAWHARAAGLVGFFAIAITFICWRDFGRLLQKVTCVIFFIDPQDLDESRALIYST